MSFLGTEREVLERRLPGLDARLAAHPLAELERPGSPAIAAFRDAGGAALLVPEHHTGIGASPLEAVRLQRAVGARCPSLAVATTMHHFSVAGLVEIARHGAGFEWMLLEAIVGDRLLLASGFAEGRTGQSVLRPAITAQRRGDHILLNGSKKPCSLAHSMDVLTASVTMTDAEGTERLAVAIVPAKSHGVSVRPFWRSSVLAGAESEEVVLTDVELDPQMVVLSDVTAGSALDSRHLAGFLWCELLMTAGYVGTASALVERVLRHGGGSVADRAALVTEVDAAMLSVEAVAREMGDTSGWGEALLVKALTARYAAQDAIARTTQAALTALGGMSFIGSDEGTYLATAATGLNFHPPSRGRTAEALCAALDGQALRVG
ncbi:putative isobutylamine N-hydroxylase [Streptomyces sp. NBRC 110611]|uniref:acyl-CoA dehydrogenase family protein n=1 Tax=Streptomyces sp. NBRC 110611 TaxID=1621259 RepID=UPI00082C8CC1|nr:acyl-CoA dehydrogenase family protein [Streptomyces sp. NBRC 110611]GAU71075.1 putative isobutylamine N-hydroxylase [Streptomyces sp. NBRC 110611]